MLCRISGSTDWNQGVCCFLAVHTSAFSPACVGEKARRCEWVGGWEDIGGWVAGWRKWNRQVNTRTDGWLGGVKTEDEKVIEGCLSIKSNWGVFIHKKRGNRNIRRCTVNGISSRAFDVCPHYQPAWYNLWVNPIPLRISRIILV